MVKLNWNTRAVGFRTTNTVQVEYSDYEGDTLAAELNLEEAARLANGLVNMFAKAHQMAQRKHSKGRKPCGKSK